MTTIATQAHTRNRLRSPQTRLLIVLALLAVAGVLFVWIVSGGGGTASHSLGGPNEAARGAAVYSAAGGAVAPTGGPNGTPPGPAVSVASGSAAHPRGAHQAAPGPSGHTGAPPACPA